MTRVCDSIYCSTDISERHFNAKYCSQSCKKKSNRRSIRRDENGVALYLRNRGDGLTKRCSRCQKTKVVTDFYPLVGSISGFRSECISCCSEMNSANAEIVRGNVIKDEQRKAGQKRRQLGRIGWTPEMVDTAVLLQGGTCANPSCDKQVQVSGKNLRAADHDHDTGEARGVLCPSCNIALGHMAEDPECIRGLAIYAEQCLNAKAWW